MLTCRSRSCILFVSAVFCLDLNLFSSNRFPVCTCNTRDFFSSVFFTSTGLHKKKLLSFCSIFYRWRNNGHSCDTSVYMYSQLYQTGNRITKFFQTKKAFYYFTDSTEKFRLFTCHSSFGNSTQFYSFTGKVLPELSLSAWVCVCVCVCVCVRERERERERETVRFYLPLFIFHSPLT